MTIRTILIPALLLASVAGANAQQRKCDMAINLIEPAPSAVINAFAQYNIRVNIANHGPDTLFTGDTLYYNKPTQPSFDYDTYILTQPIFPGSNLTLTLETLNNVNTDETDQVMDYYLYVVSNLANNGRFIDTANDANNYDVNANVTFKAGKPTAIDDMTKGNALLELYPNPASSGILLQTGPGQNIRKARVADMTGREVMIRTFAGSAKQPLDISALLPGMYLVQVETDKGRATARFIKK